MWSCTKICDQKSQPPMKKRDHSSYVEAIMQAVTNRRLMFTHLVCPAKLSSPHHLGVIVAALYNSGET